MAGNVQINLVQPAFGPVGGPGGGLLGTMLWRGLQSGSERRPPPIPTNQFFM